jgi:DNA-3-methyladenine glycosylase II
VELTIRPLPPFTTKHWRRAYSRFQDSSFSWDEEEILVVIDAHPEPGVILIREEGTVDSPLLRVSWQGPLREEGVRQLVARLLGSNEPVKPFYQKFAKDPVMRSLTEQFAGTRMPRTRSFFEALVTTILEQQVSMKAAATLRERLIQKWSSRKAFFAKKELPAFPHPEDIASCSVDDLCQIGMSRAKARSILQAAQMLQQGKLDTHSLEKEDPQSLIAFLATFPGIGNWSARFIVTRWLGPPDVFACSDLGVRKALGQFYFNGKVPSPAESERFMECFSPWRRLAGFYLLLAYTGGDAT